MNIEYLCYFYFDGNRYGVTGVVPLPERLLAKQLKGDGSIGDLICESFEGDFICKKCGSLNSARCKIIKISWTFDVLRDPEITKMTDNKSINIYDKSDDCICTAEDCFYPPDFQDD